MIVAGLDGYRLGWIVAIGRIDDPCSVEIESAATLGSLFDGEGGPALAAVDIPIGLPSFAGPGGRAAEVAARAVLGARKSSVFSTPCRAAVYAGSYPEACRINQASSFGSKKVSKQSFMIAPKIREADGLLRARPELRSRVHETHPEVAFWRMNGERPLEHAKKVKSLASRPGLEERQALLARQGMPERLWLSPRPPGSGPDDVLDALAGWVVARRIARGEAASFPADPPADDHGIVCAIRA